MDTRSIIRSLRLVPQHCFNRGTVALINEKRIDLHLLLLTEMDHRTWV